MGKISSVFLIFTMFLVAELLFCCSGEEGNATLACILREKNALLKFKATLSDPSDRLSSWNGTTDCCKWQGVTCDGISGHVTGLDLSLLSMLDLSHNQLIVDDFAWVSHLSLLKHLNLSRVDLSGTNDLLKVLNILPFLIDLRMSGSGLENRNLQHACVNSAFKHIEYLDLSNNHFHGYLPCFLENMTSLRYLLISLNDYTSCDQIHIVKLTNLVQLDLDYNSLNCSVDSISEFILDKPHLEYLSLYNNSCSGDVLKILLNLSRYTDPKLEYLDLGNNHFYGQLPEEIGGIRKLEFLALDFNNISGPIPTSIGSLSALEYLVLPDNQLLIRPDE